MSHADTSRAVEIFERLTAVVARHLGSCQDLRRWELAGVCGDGESALEMLALWPAAPERASLVDLALDAAHDELVDMADEGAVTRDRLAGGANIRIEAAGLTQEVAVLGPGGEELADRLLVSVLGPCRPPRGALPKRSIEPDGGDESRGVDDPDVSA